MKLNSSLHKITDVSFPFKHLTLVENWPKAPDGIEPWLWGMIADSIEVRGPVATLANLPNDLQKKALKAIKQETSSVWRPELILVPLAECRVPILEMSRGEEFFDMETRNETF